MKFNIEYRCYFYVEVEADCIEDAIDKADEQCDKFSEQNPEVGYSELSYADWYDADGKFHDIDYNL